MIRLSRDQLIKLATPPGATLEEEMEARDLSLDQFAQLSGLNAETIARLIEGDELLTEEIASRLEASLGIPARMWLGMEECYRERLARESSNA